MIKYILFFLSITCFPLALTANETSDAGKVDAYSVYKNTVCALHENTIDMVDWSDINHPKKLSSLNIITHEKDSEEADEDSVRVVDVALTENYAYVALENEGISVVDIHDKRKPREIKYVSIGYQGRRNEQALQLRNGMLYVSSFNKNGYTKFPLDIRNPSDPKWLTPYKKYGFITPYDVHSGGYQHFCDPFTVFPGYYISVHHYGAHGIDEMNVVSYDSSRAGATQIPLDTSRIKNEITDVPMTRAQGEIAVVTYGNRLWFIDLCKAEILYKKDYDSRVEVVAYNGRMALLDKKNDPGGYLLADVNKPDAVLSWRRKLEDPAQRYDPVFLILSSILLVEDGLLHTGVYGYDISKIGSIRRIDLPFTSWGKEMKWILKSGDILFGCGWNEKEKKGFVTIADCTDVNNIKVRGTIKGVFAGPKGFQIQGNRLYILDTGSPDIEKDNWRPNAGILKVFDIGDLDHPAVKGQYISNEN